MQPTLAPELCLEKQTLDRQIRRLMDQILTLNRRHSEAVARGDLTESEILEDRLRRARHLEDEMIRQYKEHLAHHLC